MELASQCHVDDPPERAARIRSQVLERYHNKLVEGEHDIQLRRHAIKQKIQQEVKETEREYQKRRRGIEKGFTRASQSWKQELMEVFQIDEQFQKYWDKVCIDLLNVCFCDCFISLSIQ